MLHGLEKGDVRALHRTRVATRRLRELLPVLHLEADLAERLTRRLRKATERLGSVRELDVLMALATKLGESDRYPADALARLTAFVNKERKASRRKLMAKAPIAELHRLGRKLEAVVRDGETRPADRARGRTPERSVRWAAEARVARRAGRLGDAIEEAGAVYLPERLHVVRIAVKKLRYALEVASESGASIARPDLRLVKYNQDLLGRLHDLQILIDRTRQVQASLVPPSVVVWRSLEGLVDALEQDCRRLHGRYMRGRDALTALSGRFGGRAQAAARVTA